MATFSVTFRRQRLAYLQVQIQADSFADAKRQAQHLLQDCHYKWRRVAHHVLQRWHRVEPDVVIESVRPVIEAAAAD